MSFAPRTIVSRRAYATLSGLSQSARPWAEKLSTEWKGTHAAGGNTKNYIGGQFVDSKASVWHDVVDPVCLRSLSSYFTNVFHSFSPHKHYSRASPRPPPPSLSKPSMRLLRPTKLGADRASCPVSVLLLSPLFFLSVLFPRSSSCSARLQNQIRQNADALAASIVLEQGKTLTGMSVFIHTGSESSSALVKMHTVTYSGDSRWLKLQLE